jgi:GTPase
MAEDHRVAWDWLVKRSTFTEAHETKHEHHEQSGRTFMDVAKHSILIGLSSQLVLVVYFDSHKAAN